MFESQDFRQQFLTKMRDAEEFYMYTKTKTTSLYGMLFLPYTGFSGAVLLCTRKINIKSIPPSPALQNFNFVLFQYSQACLDGVEREAEKWLWSCLNSLQGNNKVEFLPC